MTIIRRPFVFMRHGETPLNAAGLMGGITDSPLSERGIEQAKAAQGRLDRTWSVVAISGLQRTRITALHAVPQYEPIVLLGLNERNWGDLEQQPIAQQTPYEVTPPNGEPWADFQARVIDAINQLLTHYDTPLIIAHSGVNRVLNNVILGSPYGPRINNAEPTLFTPSQDNDWLITPY